MLYLAQRGGDWAGPQPAQSPPRCTKCNSPPINVLLYNGPLLCGFNVPVKGLSDVILQQTGAIQIFYLLSYFTNDVDMIAKKAGCVIRRYSQAARPQRVRITHCTSSVCLSVRPVRVRNLKQMVIESSDLTKIFPVACVTASTVLRLISQGHRTL